MPTDMLVGIGTRVRNVPDDDARTIFVAVLLLSSRMRYPAPAVKPLP